jgi:hypothetical protein
MLRGKMFLPIRFTVLCEEVTMRWRQFHNEDLKTRCGGFAAISVFWYVKPCTVTESCRGVAEICCFHRQVKE